MKHLIALVLAMFLGGCDAAPAPNAAPAATPPPQQPVEMLPTPFTAEQIRDEWIPGLTLVMHTRTPDGETWERWTVAAADAEGAEIEFVEIDAEGTPIDAPRQGRSSWIALRNHASYPAAAATREQTTRDTALGQLEGWLYQVRDGAGGETEAFFANDLPGAPLEMRVKKDDAMVMELTQIERTRPPAD